MHDYVAGVLGFGPWPRGAFYQKLIFLNKSYCIWRI